MPLSPAARDLLQSLPRFIASEYVFTTTGRSAVSGFGRVKYRLDQASGICDWRVHDLRRTVASGMAKLGVAPHVVEKLQPHSPPRLLTFKQLIELGISFSREHIRRLEEAGKFPKRIRLSPQKIVWFEDEILRMGR